jgi:hypothetical protein
MGEIKFFIKFNTLNWEFLNFIKDFTKVMEVYEKVKWSFSKSFVERTTEQDPKPNQPHNSNSYHNIKLYKTHKHHNYNINTKFLVIKWKPFEHLNCKINPEQLNREDHYNIEEQTTVKVNLQEQTTVKVYIFFFFKFEKN